MTGPGWLNDEEQRLWRSFLHMQRALAVAVERQLTEAGLSSADYEVLAQLSEAPHGTMRVRDLGRSIDWDRSRIAHQLRRMEQRALVGRSNCPSDGRGTMVAITAEGRTVIEAAAPGHVETIRRVFFDQLNPEELPGLIAVTDKITAAARALESSHDSARPEPGPTALDHACGA
jgi:DNA-binding MarR family transcriptional regulator